MIEYCVDIQRLKQDLNLRFYEETGSQDQRPTRLGHSTNVFGPKPKVILSITFLFAII